MNEDNKKKHKKGECEIVDKVCLTCGQKFDKPTDLVQIRIPVKREDVPK